MNKCIVNVLFLMYTLTIKNKKTLAKEIYLMKLLKLIIILLSVFILVSCQPKEVPEEIIIPNCDQAFNMSLGQRIPFLSMSIPYSDVLGNQDNFINYCKPIDINPLYFISSSIRTHQVILTFDAIYPIDILTIRQTLDTALIENVSIEVSYNGLNYTRLFNQYELITDKSDIDFGGSMAKSIKLIFASDDQKKGILDIRATLADGIIIQEDQAWTNTFLRYNGWTGADGIFTFNLTDGNESIGAAKDTVGFIFSDTFIGEVYENNKLRKSSVMINNSLGYMNTNAPFDQAFSFDWRVTNDKPDNPFNPDTFIGKQARNLMDGDGLLVSQSKDTILTSSSEGISYLTNQIPESVVIDLKDVQSIKDLYIWNYNAVPSYGTKTFNLYISDDNEVYTLIDQYSIDQATGSNTEPYTLHLELESINARYIKLELTESYDTTYVGLGKIMIFNGEGQFLFGQASSNSNVTELHPNETSSRLWLQDGIVIGNHLYIFPILVKDEADLFKVHNVGLIKAEIKSERIDYENATYSNTPLQYQTNDGGIVYFGAGLLNNTANDGYVYIYGYKDIKGLPIQRNLVVGRFRSEDIEDFNKWTFFDGENFTHDMNDVAPLKDKVSTELSVTYISESMFSGKYMLVVMENTNSGIISFALSDTPYGPFGDYQKIYETSEHTYLRSAFSYNAKMHPALSKPGEYLISYNVNTSQVGALSDARIYYPRFIRMIEVKK